MSFQDEKEFLPIGNGQCDTVSAEQLVEHFLGDRQRIVIDWGARCFGADHMADPIVRGARFFEEAAELAQAIGLPRDHAMRAFNHVYSREPGDPAQEVGGVANTLMALCGAVGLSFNECQKAEIERCLAKSPEHFAERNKAKLREVDADTRGTPAWRYTSGSRELLSLESFRDIIDTGSNPAQAIWNLVSAYIVETEDRIIDAEFKANEIKCDAERWRALMASDRIKIWGWAGYGSENRGPDKDGYRHFGGEFWTKHDGKDDAMCQRETRHGCEILTGYADALRAVKP